MKYALSHSLVVFLGCASLLGIGKAEEQAPKKPNVILMLADDLGYGDISCNGSIVNRTPVLDRLAKEGVRLTDYHSGATVCTPSRMALLTGCHPRRLGWPGGVLGYKMMTTSGLATEVRTIAEVFRDAGYRTAMFGKWHLGDAPDRRPLAQGFDQAYYIKMSNNQTDELWDNDKLAEKPFDNHLLTQHFTEHAITFIRENHEHPFFLYLPFTAPHFPVEAHPDWKGKSKNAAFGDVVEELDFRVGQIMDTLREFKIDSRTLVIFTSDNGPEKSRRYLTTAEPYRGKKWDSLEGGTRVPFIAIWPGVISPKHISDDLVSAVDLLPTLAHAVGISLDAKKLKPSLDGLQLWNTFLGIHDGTTQKRQDLLLWDGWATPQAIRVGKWKLYFDTLPEIEGSDTGPVLFNLGNDIKETKNMAAQHPEKVTEMLALARKKLDSIAADSIPLGGGPKKPVVPPSPRWLR